MAEWLCSGLQSRGRRFDSGLSLQKVRYAQVAKSVDARDLKSLGYCSRAGSTPALGTIFIKDSARYESPILPIAMFSVSGLNKLKLNQVLHDNRDDPANY